MVAYVGRSASYDAVFVAALKDAIDRCVSEEKSMRCNVDLPLFVLTELLSFTAWSHLLCALHKSSDEVFGSWLMLQQSFELNKTHVVELASFGSRRIRTKYFGIDILS